MFPRVDFPWVFQLDAESRRLDVFEDYTRIETVSFDEHGVGGTCSCDGYWDTVLCLPEMPPLTLGRPAAPGLGAAVMERIRRAFPGGPAGPLIGAPRESTRWVTRIEIEGQPLWVPDSPVGGGGCLLFRDNSRRVGLVDLRPVVAVSDVQRLLTRAHGDLDLRVLDDYSVFRAMRVVDVVRDPERECDRDEAREVDVDAALGDEVYWPISVQWAHLVLRWAAGSRAH